MYLNKNAQYQLIRIEEGYLDALRAQLKADAKTIAAKKAAVYYTWKNGKLFLFFDKDALGIKDAISVWIQDLVNKFLRFITGTKIDEKELKEFKIKKGADVQDVKYVLDYYGAKKQLDAITYNKLCNTWSYLVLPLVKGKKAEKFYRDLINELNGKALPNDVLKNPEVLNKKYFHCDVKDKN